MLTLNTEQKKGRKRSNVHSPMICVGRRRRDQSERGFFDEGYLTFGEDADEEETGKSGKEAKEDAEDAKKMRTQLFKGIVKKRSHPPMSMILELNQEYLGQSNWGNDLGGVDQGRFQLSKRLGF
ncbi:hypothetical protein U1Q18_037792 [Sarracenia purpurea var. burkii]